MEIKGPNKTDKSSETKKKKSTSTGDSTFKNMVEGGKSDTSGVGQSQAITQIDALLAVQGAEDPTQKAARKRMKMRAHDLLNELEDLRMALLSGNMTIGDVVSVADVVATRREKITDPELTAVLDEIDLRAQVELAKISVALNK